VSRLWDLLLQSRLSQQKKTPECKRLPQREGLLALCPFQGAFVKYFHLIPLPTPTTNYTRLQLEIDIPKFELL
jgi:hypothetical protein